MDGNTPHPRPRKLAIITLDPQFNINKTYTTTTTPTSTATFKIKRQSGCVFHSDRWFLTRFQPFSFLALVESEKIEESRGEEKSVGTLIMIDRSELSLTISARLNKAYRPLINGPHAVLYLVIVGRLRMSTAGVHIGNEREMKIKFSIITGEPLPGTRKQDRSVVHR